MEGGAGLRARSSVIVNTTQSIIYITGHFFVNIVLILFGITIVALRFSSFHSIKPIILIAQTIQYSNMFSTNPNFGLWLISITQFSHSVLEFGSLADLEESC